MSGVMYLAPIATIDLRLCHSLVTSVTLLTNLQGSFKNSSSLFFNVLLKAY